MSDPKARIISHMNKEHQMALIDYLVVYGKVKLPLINELSVKMVNINEKGMTISFKDILANKVQNMIVLWDMAPEDENIIVSDMGDIKAKLVSMAKFAGKAQGYSHIKIKKFPKPTFISYFLFFCILMLFVESFFPKFIRGVLADDFVFSRVGEYTPSFILTVLGVTENYASIILLSVFTTHIIEIIFFLLPKLAKYRVPHVQRLTWIVVTFFDGFNSLLRLESLAK